jgi:protein sidekick
MAIELIIDVFFILVPSRAPTNLTAHNESSTSLMINWGPVPGGKLHGILRGYRVLYKMAENMSSSFVSLTTNALSRNLKVSSLKKFTVYIVKVLAFTVKGDGPETVNISVSTDEDGKQSS